MPPVSVIRLRHSSQAHSVDHFASSSPAAPPTCPPDWPGTSSQPRLPDDISRQCLNPPPPPGAARSSSKYGNQLSCQRPQAHGPSLSGRRSRPCDQVPSVGATRWATLSSPDRLSSPRYLVCHGSVFLSPPPSCRRTPFSCATVRVPLRRLPISIPRLIFPFSGQSEF